MYLFRGEAPVAEMARAMPKAIRPAFRLFGRAFLHEYPYSEAYLLPYARQFRAALSMPLILLGGINRVDTVRDALAEGFEFVAMGRALLREPDLVRRWQAGATARVAVRALQQVHGDDLPRHPVRAGGMSPPSGQAPAATARSMPSTSETTWRRWIAVVARTSGPSSRPLRGTPSRWR